ncbi:MAG: hypothetical protein K6C33_11245 [Desulfovibrio sp.]|nr:hypothetical protein [Desulfovibrio sp.]
MRLAPLCLALLFALVSCPWNAPAAGPAAPAAAGGAATPAGQPITQDALQGFWLGSQEGRDVVVNFSAFFITVSSSARYDKGIFQVKDGSLFLRPDLGKVKSLPVAMEGGELVLDGLRLRRLLTAEEVDSALAPDVAGWVRTFAARDHALDFCNVKPSPEETKLVQDYLDADPKRRCLYIVQRQVLGSVCVYDPAGWCRDQGIRSGLGAR